MYKEIRKISNKNVNNCQTKKKNFPKKKLSKKLKEIRKKIKIFEKKKSTGKIIWSKK